MRWSDGRSNGSTVLSYLSNFGMEKCLGALCYNIHVVNRVDAMSPKIQNVELDLFDGWIGKVTLRSIGSTLVASPSCSMLKYDLELFFYGCDEEWVWAIFPTTIGEGVIYGSTVKFSDCLEGWEFSDLVEMDVYWGIWVAIVVHNIEISRCKASIVESSASIFFCCIFSFSFQQSSITTKHFSINKMIFPSIFSAIAFFFSLGYWEPSFLFAYSHRRHQVLSH